MPVRQEVLNVALAQLLQERGLVAAPEQVLRRMREAGDEGIALPHEVPRQAVAVGDRIVMEAPAHADLVEADRIQAVGLDHDRATLARTDAQRASH